MKTEEILLTYGDKCLSSFIPQKTLDSGKYIPLVLPAKKPVIKTVKESLLAALEEPVGPQKPLSTLVKECLRGGDVALIVDDHDRPNVHTRLLLPVLLELLQSEYQIAADKIKVVIATGTHRAPTPQEIEKILGPGLCDKVKYVIHKGRENNVEVAQLDGHKLEIDAAVYNSNLIIPLTDVENHYFAGVAGGPKAFCPGVCGVEIITYEHLHMFGTAGFTANVDLGIMDGNPVFETKKRIVGTAIEALKKENKAVYALETIIDTEDELVYLKGGELFESHRQAAEVLKEVWTVQVRQKPDIVISGASIWGVNLYQMGKATHCAYLAVRKGGVILNAAPCPQAWANEEFRNLMKIGMAELNRHEDKAAGIRKTLEVITDVVKQDFKIGKQKPVDIFQILNYVGWGNLHLIQDGIPESDYGLLPFVIWGNKSQRVEDRLRSWIEKHLGDQTITVINNPGFLVKAANE